MSQLFASGGQNIEASTLATTLGLTVWSLLAVQRILKETHWNRVEREVGGDEEYLYIHGWFMSMYDKNHYNIIK